MFRHLFHAVEGLVDLLRSFETEGDGDDAHGEDAQFLADACDDGCCSGAGASAHAGGDECHLGAVAEHVAHVLKAFFGGLARLFGLVASTESLFAELQVDGHWAVVECLVVGIAEHEGHVVYAFAIHVVHGIASTSAYADHFDDAILFFRLAEI